MHICMYMYVWKCVCLCIYVDAYVFMHVHVNAIVCVTDQFKTVGLFQSRLAQLQAGRPVSKPARAQSFLASASG